MFCGVMYSGKDVCFSDFVLFCHIIFFKLSAVDILCYKRQISKYHFELAQFKNVNCLSIRQGQFE